jgi:hypothetical protein
MSTKQKIELGPYTVSYLHTVVSRGEAAKTLLENPTEDTVLAYDEARERMSRGYKELLAAANVHADETGTMQ